MESGRDAEKEIYYEATAADLTESVNHLTESAFIGRLMVFPKCRGREAREFFETSCK